MKTENIILEKTYSFSLNIIEAYKLLRYKANEYEMSKQLLRSGTSIGANAEEGSGAQSKKDFIAKFSISLKEAKESHYWIRLLRDSNYLNTELAENLIKDCEEIIKILTAILKSSRQSI